MTTSIRKNLPTPLEKQYAEMRKDSGGNKRNPNLVKDAAADLTSNLPADTVTLSSAQPVPKLKRSEPVSPVEKQALKSLFSIRV